MVLSRRRFITSTGMIAAGSGLLLHQSCKNLNEPESQRLNMDYAGPHQYFEDFRDLCRGIEGIQITENDFEKSVLSPSRLACLAEPLGTRCVKILMLLEQGKDVLVLPPLATGYEEYNAFQQQCNQLDRRVALMNPFRYFSSLQHFRELYASGTTGNLASMDIIIDPGYNIPYLPPVEGICGTVVLLITVINEILASFPVSVMAQVSASATQENELELQDLVFDYEGMIMNCHFSAGTGGWKIAANADRGTFELRDSGELITGDGTVLVKADRHVMHKSLRHSIKNFIESVRDHEEPESNSVEGLMQISINLAVEESVYIKGKAGLYERHYLLESDREWLQENRLQL